MRQVIKNRVYDTSNAKVVGTVKGGTGLGAWEERLYRKRTGEYFLYGEGGPMTMYAKPIGNGGWIGWCRITPLAYADAREWAESHLTAHEYREEFEKDTAGKSVVTIALSIPADLEARLRRDARKADESLSHYVTGLLRAACPADEKE